MISTVLEGATIIDGSGRPEFKTDIAFAGESIVLIGDCADREARRRVDCRGKIVAPGFTDACSHTGEKWLTSRPPNSKTSQGVVGEITALDRNSSRKPWEESLTPAEIFDLAKSNRSGTYAAFFVSGDVRAAVESGASGVAIDASTLPLQEAIQLAHEAAVAGAPRVLLNVGDDAVEGVAYAISLAAYASVHICQLRTPYPRSSGAMERALETIDRARSQGAALTIDVAPYVATDVTLSSLLPSGVTPEMLRDDAVAAAVALQMQARYGEHWHDLMLAQVGSEERMAWCGMRIDEIARQTWRSPARTLLDLIRDEGDRATAFWFCLREDDVATALSADFCAIGSASASYPLDARPYGLVHPRAFGTFPRIFGRFVRQRRTLTMVEAVRRMTSLPARIFGLEEAGRIEVEAPADVVVFDENAFADTATYERPFSLPVGLHHVFRRGAEIRSAGGVS